MRETDWTRNGERTKRGGEGTNCRTTENPPFNYMASYFGGSQIYNHPFFFDRLWLSDYNREKACSRCTLSFLFFFPFFVSIFLPLLSSSDAAADVLLHPSELSRAMSFVVGITFCFYFLFYYFFPNCFFSFSRFVAPSCSVLSATLTLRASVTLTLPTWYRKVLLWNPYALLDAIVQCECVVLCET